MHQNKNKHQVEKPIHVNKWRGKKEQKNQKQLS